jgi:UDP-4-amino-4,6-dideoxy-N-acetyl-beta-L-altrosamine transaminase
MIPYARQDIIQSDIDAVIEVLNSDFLTQGPKVPAFEQEVASYCGAKHAVAVNSATSALHIACLALDVGRGDIVWTSPITFVASANCVLYCGATVDFVDIDPRTYNLSLEVLKNKLEKAEKLGTLPKVVITVHLSGQPCDLIGIHALSLRYGFKIIEDASHAIGGRYKDEPIGNCRYSDITVFSFHPVKIITTAEGGMALTNDPAILNKLVCLRSHGITRDSAEMTHAPDGPWYYQQLHLGYNYRMTEIQAALGLSQMLRLDEFVTKRHALALQYNELLEDVAITKPWQHPDSFSAMHLYIVRLRLNEIGATHREVFERLRGNDVGVNLHYIPVYRQPYYARMGFNVDEYPEAESYYGEAISLPMYTQLTKAQQMEVVKHLITPIGHQTIF